MALQYSYPDAYLVTFCTEAREARAIEDVTVLAGPHTLNADWTERLVITQTYILACLENQAEPEDLFTAKLKEYRTQMRVQLPQAIAAAIEAAGTVNSTGFFSIALERS